MTTTTTTCTHRRNPVAVTLAAFLLSLPMAGVHAAGVYAAAGAGLPFVGLAAAVAAERIGPG